jgi:cyclic pyranopterin phosphate synthase
MVLTDRYGRPLLNLRVAITKKCNINCSFCHGEGEQRHGERSDLEMQTYEIVRIVKIGAELGIRKVKLTGGEPLVRKDVTAIIKGISDIQAVTDLSMTTNGTLLAPLAEELRTNGLQRVNINLPTTDAAVYHKLTGGRVEDVLNGVKAAVEAGFCPVKINMLILNSFNDSAVPQMIDFARENGAVLQLIELEPINVSPLYYSQNHRSLDEYEAMLEKTALSVETRKYMHNRRIYQLPDVKVEVVHPIENTEFCLHCTRMRVTSDGKLKPCLMRNDNTVDILTPMRKGASDEELSEMFKLANQQRKPYNSNQTVI